MNQKVMFTGRNTQNRSNIDFELTPFCKANEKVAVSKTL